MHTTKQNTLKTQLPALKTTRNKSTAPVDTKFFFGDFSHFK